MSYLLVTIRTINLRNRKDWLLFIICDVFIWQKLSTNVGDCLSADCTNAGGESVSKIKD